MQWTNDIVVRVRRMTGKLPPTYVLSPGERQKASLALSKVSRQRKGQGDAFSPVAFSECSPALNWEKNLSCYICGSWHAEMIYSVILLLLCTQLRNQYERVAGRDVQGTAGFQQRDVLLQNEPAFLLQVFPRKHRGRKEQEAHSGMVVCLSQELLQAATCYFEPTEPKEGTRYSEV